MAFYNSAGNGGKNNRSKNQKRDHSEGSWDEEGSHYRDKQGGERPGKSSSGRTYAPQNRREAPRTDNQPAYGRPAEPKPAYGRPAPKPAYGRPAEPKPAYGRPAPKPAYGRPAEPKPVYGRPAPKPAAPVPPPTPELRSPDMPAENLLIGRNAIREALKANRDIEKLLIARGDLSGSARELYAMARERHVLIQEVDRARLDEITPHHQGMLAYASAYKYADVDDMFALAEARGQKPLIVILDGITDPQNLGAIIRTAACAGAHGIIVSERHAVGLTPAAVKTSSGAVEHVPVARVTNLNRTIEELKRHGVWIFAADMDGTPYHEADFTSPCALVIGSEGDGLSRMTREKCDYVVSLPMRPEMDSLNASVAAGILLYAVIQRRRL